MVLREWIQVGLPQAAEDIMQLPMKTASGRRSIGIRNMQGISISITEPGFSVRI